MSINLQLPKLTELRPRIAVMGIGGAGGNAVNNMIAAGLSGVEFIAANTDAQALFSSSADHRVQLGINLTEGLGAGSKPEIGAQAAEEAIDEIKSIVSGSHMLFITAGMGGGTGSGAAAVVARAARQLGILVVAVVTKPFQFEGSRRQRIAEAGIAELRDHVDTMIVIPNQNLFRVTTEKTTFAEAFLKADQVLYSGIACIVDLILREGLINLDFADVRAVMQGMGTAMMGTGEASGPGRAEAAAADAIANPLLEEVSLRGARGLLVSITGGSDMTLHEVDQAATRVREEVDPEANIIVGATYDPSLGDRLRVSIVASGMPALPSPAQGDGSSTGTDRYGGGNQHGRHLSGFRPALGGGAATGQPGRAAGLDANALQRQLGAALQPGAGWPDGVAAGGVTDDAEFMASGRARHSQGVEFEEPDDASHPIGRDGRTARSAAGTTATDRRFTPQPPVPVRSAPYRQDGSAAITGEGGYDDRVADGQGAASRGGLFRRLTTGWGATENESTRHVTSKELSPAYPQDRSNPRRRG